MIRRLALVSFFSAIAFLAGACKEETSDPEPAPADDRRVAASEESKKTYGVETWFVEPGDPGKMWIAGVDRERNVVIDIVLSVDAAHPYEGTIAFDAHGKLTSHVALHWAGEEVTSTFGALGEAEQEATLAAFSRIEKDLEAANDTVGSTKVTTQTCAPKITPKGGHVGGELVRRQQDVLREGECLIDNSGNYCGWLAIKTGVALLKTASCFRGKLHNCVLGPKAIYDEAKKSEEQGCKYRTCPK